MVATGSDSVQWLYLPRVAQFVVKRGWSCENRVFYSLQASQPPDLGKQQQSPRTATGVVSCVLQRGPPTRISGYFDNSLGVTIAYIRF